jgi:TolB-like protein/DNA-binding winged helix-turn-helix (wHTH) protein
VEGARPPDVIRFGPYEVSLHTQELFKHGRRLRLAPQAFQVLQILLEQPGQLVSREDLHGALWPADTFVDFDHGLNNAIKRIRDVLDDSADAPNYVETLPRLGYRFIGQIDGSGNGNGKAPAAVAEPPLVSALVSELKPSKRSLRFPWAAIALASIVIAALSVSGWWFFSRKTPVLTEKDTVVLADFTNTTGDPIFDGTLRQGLAIQLEQSPYFNLLSDERIQDTLHLMEQPPDAKLTLLISREVCQRTSSAAVLEGLIARMGTRYLLTLRAVRCADGSLIASSEQQAADKDHALDALGKTASAIRVKLGESLNSTQKSLVVLPLENLSRDPEQDYFADGVTEELITDLAKISTLQVISRTSAVHYKGTTKTLPQIAQELGVDAVIEGTVQRSGDRVRISAQLVEARTDRHLWADSYERDLGDVLALESDVARAIAREIRIKLTPQEHARLAHDRALNSDAHEAYLKACTIGTGSPKKT